MFFIQIYKSYGEQYITDDSFLSYIGAIGALFDGFSRLIVGSLMDRYDFKHIYKLIVLISFISTATLHWSV
jgi:nitrate/nitrite transporter NarK